MRSPFPLAAVFSVVAGTCQAFLAPPPISTSANSVILARSQSSCSLRREPMSPAVSATPRCRGYTRGLRMSSEDEESNPIPSVNDMMDKAKEADAVARAQSSQVAGPMMQSPEEKKKEVEAFELDKPKENKWASGAFKRGLALQAIVLGFVIYLQFQPAEVSNLAICAPFAKGGGCVGFGEWVEIVFFGAPMPPM